MLLRALDFISTFVQAAKARWTIAKICGKTKQRPHYRNQVTKFPYKSQTSYPAVSRLNGSL